VIDRVFSDEEYGIYFIQDPISKIDGFLFDSPWKEIAVDLEKLMRG